MLYMKRQYQKSEFITPEVIDNLEEVQSPHQVSLETVNYPPPEH